MVRGPRDEAHWPDMAEVFIGGVAAAVLNFSPPERCHLLTVGNILADRRLLDETVEALRASAAWDGALALLGHVMTHAGKEELESILSTADRLLRFHSSPAAAASLKASRFDPGDLTRGRCTVYLVVPAVHLRPMAGLVRLWLSAFHRAVVRGGGEVVSLVHMVIDEAAALGPHEAINDMLNLGRGYGLRVHLFYQNAAQLMRCYPDGQHQFVLGTTTNIYFGAHDWVTCEEISKRTGSSTVVVGSGGDGDGDSRQSADGTGHGSFGTSRNRSRNWSFTGKPLLRPEQVAALPDRVAITFPRGPGPRS